MKRNYCILVVLPLLALSGFAREEMVRATVSFEENDLVNAVVGTWKWPTAGSNEDSKTTVVVTRRTIVISSPNLVSAQRWFLHPGAMLHVNEREMHVQGLLPQDVLCLASYNDLNKATDADPARDEWLIFSKDRKTVQVYRQSDGGKLYCAATWTKTSNSISEEAKAVEALLPPVNELPSKEELDARKKQREEAEAVAATDEKELKATRRAEAIAKAPIYHLKDGRTIIALSVLKDGSDTLLRDEKGAMFRVKDEELERIEVRDR